MFDPLTQSVQRKGSSYKAVEAPSFPASTYKSVTMKTGMSVIQLQQLLNNTNNSSGSPRSTHIPTSSHVSSFRNLSLTKSRKGVDGSSSGSAIGGVGGSFSPKNQQRVHAETEEEDEYTKLNEATISKRQLEERVCIHKTMTLSIIVLKREGGS
jgi:peptidoglycan hydrolase-like protein with peptidoglycan-binding domain